MLRTCRRGAGDGAAQEGRRVVVLVGEHRGQRGTMLDKKGRSRRCNCRRNSRYTRYPWTTAEYTGAGGLIRLRSARYLF